MAFFSSNSIDVLEPSVAGRFYPADPTELSNDVNRYIGDADIQPTDERVLAVLSPHAGYVFSGPVAGYSFRFVQNQSPDTVLVIGICHQGVEGGCVFSGLGIKTPLGQLDVDTDLVNALLDEGKPIHADARPFMSEHSVEVNLPFIQTAFPDAKVAAMLVSHSEPDLCKSLGETIARVIQQDSGKSVLIVVSSDMSHYPVYDIANRVDQEMLDSLETMDTGKILPAMNAHLRKPEPELHCVMCGGGAMLTAVETALALGSGRAKTLHYQNSGDSGYGEKDRVVGYGSFAIFTP